MQNFKVIVNPKMPSYGEYIFKEFTRKCIFAFASTEV